MGFEAMVSKQLTAAYRSGRSSDWIKVKNPDSPGYGHKIWSAAAGDADVSADAPSREFFAMAA
jgi:hypothetical protein